MNIEELLIIQKKLDIKIMEEHGLQGRDLVPAKILALQVEIGELANETRCFKFWSKKAPGPFHVILEEYVDCLHFVLSIGLDRGLEKVVDSLSMGHTKGNLMDQFPRVYQSIERFRQKQDAENYQDLFIEILQLATDLGFSWKDIAEAYLEKNKINIQRQEEGY